MKPLGYFLAILLVVLGGSVAMAATLEVGPGKDFITIQAAINAANPAVSDDVLVYPGTYPENINFSGKNIAVVSASGPGVTIIDGGGLDTVVKFENGENSNAVLSGFTITNGSAGNGGGIHCNGSSPSLDNLSIISNTATFGGGIRCNNASPTVKNSKILNNSASSGAGGGIICNNNSTATLVNVVIADNSASIGGGIWCIYSSGVDLTNVTISGNTGAGIGAKHHCDIILKNTIVWNDAIGFDYTETPLNTLDVQYSDIEGGQGGIGNPQFATITWGPGNIDADPLFVGSGDYHLRCGSPCIDAGDNDAVPGGVTTDLDGNPRFVNDLGMPDTGNGTPPIVDMGAYESQLVNSAIAWNPNPADDAKCVELPVVLSWTPGCWAAKHDVYFGTDFAAVNNATISTAGIFKGRQDPNSYNPGGLVDEPCKTYYWRVDEVNGPTIWKGDVWSFTTTGPTCCPCIDPPEGMVAWWTFDEEPGTTIANDIAGSINDQGTLINGASFTSGMVGGGLFLDGVNDYVDVPNSPELNFGEGNLSVDMWVNLAPNQYDVIATIIDKRTGVHPTQGYTLFLNDHILSFQLADGAGNGSGNCGSDASCMNYLSGVTIANGEWNHIAVTVDRGQTNGGIWYVNGNEVGNRFNPTFINKSLTNSAPLWIGRHANWGSSYIQGILDEIELYNRVLDANEIRAIFNAGSTGKCKCKPAPAYRDDIKWSQPPERDYLGCINGWDEVSDYNIGPIVADDWVCKDDRPIKDIHWWGSFKGWDERKLPADAPAAFHIGIWTDVPDPEPNNPNTFSHPDRLIWEKRCESFVWSYAGCDLDPRGEGELDACFKFDQLLSQDEWFYQDPNSSAGTVYWLSIAAIYSDDDMAPVPNVLIDDFESYADSAGLLATWNDGSVNGTGSSSALETTITHGGAQAMKVDYDNANPPFYSEVRRTYPVPQNWTIGGVKQLGLWFRGQAGNAVEPMYVTLGDSANNYTSVYPQDPNVVTNGYWQFWCIDLGDFTGLNLTAVKKVYIGLGNKHAPGPNGSGTVYFDDIGLYQECRGEPKYAWGWKTRPHFYNDDAVRITSLGGQWPPVIGSVWAGGEPIEYAAGTSWDVAFVLTTNREYQPMKWWWPNEETRAADIYPDGVINLKDMAVLAGNWLTEGEVWPEMDMP